MASTVAIEDTSPGGRAAPDPALWFQLYVQPDLKITEASVRRAESACCCALVLTADSPALGRNERGDRNDFHDLPPGHRVREHARAGGADRPVRSYCPRTSRGTTSTRLREITDSAHRGQGRAASRRRALAVERGSTRSSSPTTAAASSTPRPRRSTRCPIADAVGGPVPLLLDSGVRRGTGVVKALALGADAVAIGRPAVWGLAAGGEEGVRAVLDELLRRELENAADAAAVSRRAEREVDLGPRSP